MDNQILSFCEACLFSESCSLIDQERKINMKKIGIYQEKLGEYSSVQTFFGVPKNTFCDRLVYEYRLSCFLTIFTKVTKITTLSKKNR